MRASPCEGRGGAGGAASGGRPSKQEGHREGEESWLARATAAGPGRLDKTKLELRGGSAQMRSFAPRPPCQAARRPRWQAAPAASPCHTGDSPAARPPPPPPVPQPRSRTAAPCQLPKGGRRSSRSASTKPACHTTRPTRSSSSAAATVQAGAWHGGWATKPA